MTKEELFYLLSNKNGSYFLSYLISLEDEKTKLNYVNSSKDIFYDGVLYKSEVFSFSANADILGFFGGGTLEIARLYEIVSLLENNQTITIKVKGVLYNNQITPLVDFESHFCTATFSKSTIKIAMEKDDRLSMTFPATIFNAFNNQGNS
ncbi:hypothetical protein [Treponema pectinovorum]|uniref:hypothetical protein n=1 Tax=Treponema pectinovorum TaxID=164 RepID=UPI0011C7D8D1|nr:hypothetical protein [Treponema pectinovorum]